MTVAALLVLTGCGSSSKTPASAPTSTTVDPTTVEPRTTTPTATGTAASLGRTIPVTVQSDAAMLAAGNHGPSSSVLVPSSCTVTSTTATATGDYRGGFAPEVYRRYGDVIDLYVFSGPVPGYAEGMQLAAPFTRSSPTIAAGGAWTVTVPIEASLGQPARCLIAAQPTHDFEGAPSAY